MSTKINKSDMPCDEFINLVRDVKFTYMGKEKYYTPSIEEFFVGFEFEFRSSFEDSINSSWNKLIYSAFPVEMPEVFYYGLATLDKNQFRVKYLDASDIEELGFTVIKTKGNAFEAIKKFNFTYEDCTTEGEYNIIVGGDKYCIIKLKDIGETILFRGEIKNKNVLKQVLKMLDIK